MLRRAFVTAWACVHVAGAAAAQVGSVDVEVSSAFKTKYIWNGFDRIANRGLDAGPVVQPRVDVAVEGSPLRAHVAGSFIMNEHSELHETLYGVYVERTTSPLASVSLGYNYYDDRAALVDLGSEADVHEIWGAITMRSTVGTRTRIIGKYEIPSADGFGPYSVFVGEIGYGVPLVPVVTAGGFGVDFDATTAVIYTSAIDVDDVEVVDRGISAWQVSVAGHVKTGHVKLSPAVHYQMTFKDTVNEENPFWVGVNVSYAF